MKKRFKKAFTLAEVLIALTIIGVIAAITVPALVQRTNKQEYVTALQKAYSTLSQATNMIIAEHGSPKADENGSTWLSLDNAFNLYLKYLNNVKICEEGKTCYYKKRYKFLGGADDLNYWGNESTTSWRKSLILADGTVVTLFALNRNCNTPLKNWTTGDENYCALFFTDLNGRKGPNMFGRDSFFFVLKEDGLHPAGCSIAGYCDEKSNRGRGCACKVLREGAMNY